MLLFAAALLAIAAIAYTLFVRAKDLPEPEPESPVKHLDDRKATIYENLRDLQFEYRLGKLSDQDYQQTKADLQRELAAVMAEIDRLKGVSPPPPPKPAPKKAAGLECPHCGTKLPKPMKFCGECGKPLTVEVR
jgi:hypothetical protein